jgi:hypothetical protein
MKTIPVLITMALTRLSAFADPSTMQTRNRAFLASLAAVLFAAFFIPKADAQQFYGYPTPSGLAWHVLNDQPFPIHFYVHIQSAMDPTAFANSERFLLRPGNDTGSFTAPIPGPVVWTLVP